MSPVTTQPTSSKPLLSQRHPLLYHAAVWSKRMRRYWMWYTGGIRYASRRTSEDMPIVVKEHRSSIIKQFKGTDPQLQINKRTNLLLASARIDGIVIAPGQTFSFCKLVGRTTKRKGYLSGMEFTMEEPKTGIGGGVCQIANLIHWMVLHSPLTVTERHHHQFDPFPDNGRVLPFGTGATVFYNYRDFQVANTTQQSFQIRLRVTDEYLEGELRTDTELPLIYRLTEENHRFVQKEGVWYRQNEIWRETYLKLDPETAVGREIVIRNDAKLLYDRES